MASIRLGISIIIALVSSFSSDAQRRSAETYLQRADDLLEANKEAEALGYLDTCLAKQPENIEALFLRARIYSNQHRYQEALTDYLKLNAIDPENKEALYSCGVARYQLGHYRMALDDFNASLDLPGRATNTAYFKIDPWQKNAVGISTISRMEVDLWNFIGLCHSKLTEYNEALVAYNKGLQIESRNIDLLVNRAMVYEAMEKPQLALADYETVLLLDPHSEVASLNLVKLRSKEEQLQALNTFVANRPSHPQGYEKRGLLFFEMELYQNAEKDLERALELQPENDEYLFNLALVRFKMGNLTDAGTLFIELTDRDPRHAGAYFNLGNIMYRQKNFDAAVSYYTMAIQHQPGTPSFLYNRALALFETNLPKRACEDMRLANDLDPELGNEFLDKFCGSN